MYPRHKIASFVLLALSVCVSHSVYPVVPSDCDKYTVYPTFPGYGGPTPPAVDREDIPQCLSWDSTIGHTLWFEQYVGAVRTRAGRPAYSQSQRGTGYTGRSTVDVTWYYYEVNYWWFVQENDRLCLPTSGGAECAIFAEGQFCWEPAPHPLYHENWKVWTPSLMVWTTTDDWACRQVGRPDLVEGP